MNFRLFILFALLRTFSFAQNAKPDTPTPPNCIWLYDNVFIDKTEIANIHWLEFLYSIKRDSSEAFFLSMIPDSTVWEELDPFKELLVTYLKHGSEIKTSFYSLFTVKNSVYGGLRYNDFLYYPVVGITYFQAMNFCRWRTEATRKKNYSHNKTLQITYRLPTEEEWIYAASAGLDTSIYSFGYKQYMVKNTLIPNPDYYWDHIKDTTEINHHLFNQVFNKFIKYGEEPFFNCTKHFLKFFNYGMMQPGSIYDLSNRPPRINKNFSILNETKTEKTSLQFRNAKANEYGISNMIGNAAEMTLTKGIARGGSWAHSLENCKVSTRYYYYTTTNWLGFRCVAVVNRRQGS